MSASSSHPFSKIHVTFTSHSANYWGERMDEQIGRLQSGDRDAAEALIARYEMRVRLYAAKVAPRAGMAEDIAQKAFLLALQNIHKFDPAGDFGVWMCGIVRNVG